MRLISLRASNYRSISDLELPECGPFNVLIGKNNSGKSTILAALSGFFGSLSRTSVVSLKPSLGKRIDFHKSLTTSPIEVSVTFRLDDSESAALAQSIVSEAPQMKNAAESLPDGLDLTTTIRIVAGAPRYSYVKDMVLQEYNVQPTTARQHVLLSVSENSASEIASRETQIATLIEQAEALSSVGYRLDEDDWERFRMEFAQGRRTRNEPTGPPWRYFLNRFLPHRVSDDAAAVLTTYLREESSFQDFRQALDSYVQSQNDERATLEAEALQNPVETFSGREGHVPQYVRQMLHKISGVKVHYLTDRREPIGKEEAERLLNLKVQRGGFEELKSIQDTVSALLGVQIDAFQAESPSSPQRTAELDVDDFLVEANGSGIREALRLILDVEFTHPAIVLVEEPEMHLHPGLESSMMRYLKRISSQCQVFLTTHSTNFLDTAEMNNVYLVSKGDTTKVQMVGFSEAEQKIPEELGLKLSSLFMFDRLAFVEGVTDENILREWASRSGITLSQSNVGFVPIGGSRNFLYFATEATLSFLRRRGVAMWFILDRDERDAIEIERLTAALGDRASVVILERRELENYLISPRALKEFIVLKRQLAGNVSEDINEDSVRAALDEAAEALKEIAVQKRVARTTNRPAYPRFEPTLDLTSDEDITNRIGDELDLQIEALKTTKEQAKEVLRQERERIEREWTQKKLEIVPGDELLDLVCQKFGVRFNKDRDGVRIAELMLVDEIPQEIRRILNDLSGA